MKMSSKTVFKELNDNVRYALGKNVQVSFKCKLRMETKSDKTENKIVVISPWRLYILSAKPPSKVELHFHYLEINAIESKKPNQLCLVIGEKTYTFYTIENEDKVIDSLIQELVMALRNTYPLTPLDHIIRKVDLAPQTRSQEIFNCKQTQESHEVGPCGGFSVQYACMCDYHGLPYRDEVAWDVDTIYLAHDTRELCLQDFDHLDVRDFIPIVSALEHNTWFTKLRASNIRLTAETVEQILNVMRGSVCIEELYLDNVGLRWDFVQKLSGVLMLNTSSSIHTLDLSGNLIEDKGAPHLVNALIKLPKGLKHLNLAKTGLSAKGINMLANALTVNKYMASTLTFLNLADNVLKEEVNNLYNFLAQPNSVTHLDLSGTDVALDLLFGALLRGCSQKLTHLDLHRNPFSHKKSKDVLVPSSFKQFFITTVALRYLDLSSTKLPAEALKNMLLGLACNDIATNIQLDLSCNSLGSQGVQVMENCIADVRSLSSLDISDNGLEADLIHVINAISRNKSIRKLSVGRNFSNIKSKHMAGVMESLVQLIQDDDSTIEHLSLADSKLKSDIYCIINALGSNQCLISIDISGNQMGDAGVRLLAKALQINNRLKALFYDRNNISSAGFFDLAYGLQTNYTMLYIPCPMYDACLAMKTNPERTDTALRTIENLLHRNVSPKKFSNSQAFRLQQGFVLSSTQQIVDRLAVQTEDLVKTIKSSTDGGEIVSEAEAYLKDADKSKQIMTRLHNVMMQREEPSTSIDLKLVQVTEELHRVIQNHLQGSVNCMIKCAEDQCPTVLGNVKFCKDLQKSCQDKSNLPLAFVHQCIVEQAGTDILNKLSELNLAVASHLSDRIVDEVVESLSKTYKNLIGVMNQNCNPTSDAVLRNTSGYDSDGDKICELSEKTDGTPQISSKRKSVNTRRLRPQSIVDNVDGVELESAFSSRISAEAKEGESGDGSPRPLSHLGKARPRRQKTRAATRANVRTETIFETDQNLNVGLDVFFQKSEPATPISSPQSTDNKTGEFIKPNPSTSKSDKSQKASSDKKTAKSESEKKDKGVRLVQGLSSMFSRKSSDRLSRSKSSEEVKKNKENEVTEPEKPSEAIEKENSVAADVTSPRHVAGGPKFAASDNILAEMKALQEKRLSQQKEGKDRDKSEEVVSDITDLPKVSTSEKHVWKEKSLKEGAKSPPRPVSSPIGTSVKLPESSGIVNKSPLPESPGSNRAQLLKPKPPPIAPKPRPRSMISPETRKSGDFSPISDSLSYDGSNNNSPDHSEKSEDNASEAAADKLTRADSDLGKRKVSDAAIEPQARSRSFSLKEQVSSVSSQEGLQVTEKKCDPLKTDSGFHVDDVVDV